MWIEDYRKANNLELDEFARRVNQVGRKMRPPLYGTVTDTLIHVIECSRTPRTHPRIADAIAAVCGATEEQRDSIVDKSHHGTMVKVSVVASGIGHVSREKAIVKIDPDGNVVARYINLITAEKCEKYTRDSIRERCKRQIKNEFYPFPYTYRFEREWEAMTEQERQDDIDGLYKRGDNT